MLRITPPSRGERAMASKVRRNTSLVSCSASGVLGRGECLLRGTEARPARRGSRARRPGGRPGRRPARAARSDRAAQSSSSPCTNAPRCGVIVSQPSRSRAMIASRTGMRLTPSWRAMSSWCTRSPWRNTPLKISERTWIATRSPLLGRSMSGTGENPACSSSLPAMCIRYADQAIAPASRSLATSRSSNPNSPSTASVSTPG